MGKRSIILSAIVWFVFIVFVLVGLWTWALFDMSREVGAAWQFTSLILLAVAMGVQALICEAEK